MAKRLAVSNVHAVLYRNGLVRRRKRRRHKARGSQPRPDRPGPRLLGERAVSADALTSRPPSLNSPAGPRAGAVCPTRSLKKPLPVAEKAIGCGTIVAKGS